VLTSNQVTNRIVSNSNANSFTNVINSKSSFSTTTKVVEVPVQDARTKALIHKLASEMRRLCQIYPKLTQEISPELAEYFSKEIIDVIEVDELHKLV
jgi:hypothetical protein